MIKIEELRKMDRIHSYPAKFTVDLALEKIEKYTKIGDTVYDPFVGSGTTLLASQTLKRNSYGTDINHIAILISKFKTLHLSNIEIDELNYFINTFEKTYINEVDSIELFSYPSINHWFCDDAIKILSLIKSKIDGVNNENVKVFCKLVMSSIVNLASNQESDTRYAAVIKPKLNIEYIATLFVKKFRTTLEIFNNCNEKNDNNYIAEPILLDSKRCTEVLGSNKVDLILTSPPYPNTYDYYLYHKHRMNWLEYDVKFTMEAEIGSRREFSSLKKPKEKFDDDMYAILYECNKTLKLGGHAILVMGDGRIQGEIYEAKSNMEAICNKLGWKLIDYSFSYLDQTSRSFQQSYRTKGKKEHILVFVKER